MLYLLEVNALIGAFVFSTAGVVILAMFAWQFFANSFAISRSFSRFAGREHAVSHKIQ